MTTSELAGTSAPVTGATRGFGRAIAVALHDAGANVVADARNAEQLGQLCHNLPRRSKTWLAASASVRRPM